MKIIALTRPRVKYPFNFSPIAIELMGGQSDLSRGKNNRMTVLVLGIGQSLRGDDAAGLEAVQRWRKKYPETASASGVQVETNELPGLDLLDLLSRVKTAILVDAIHSSGNPGNLFRLDPEDLADFSPGSASAHGWGVAETLSLGRALSPDLAECRIILLGIEVEHMELGQGLSPAVEAKMGELVEAIEREVRSHL